MGYIVKDQHLSAQMKTFSSFFAQRKHIDTLASKVVTKAPLGGVLITPSGLNFRLMTPIIREITLLRIIIISGTDQASRLYPQFLLQSCLHAQKLAKKGQHRHHATPWDALVKGYSPASLHAGLTLHFLINSLLSRRLLRNCRQLLVNVQNFVSHSRNSQLFLRNIGILYNP